MGTGSIAFAFFLIFFGAAVLATIALFTRQSLLVAYILLGIIVGPWGLKLIPHTQTINETSTIGIMFLLFLLGLNLQVKNLISMLRGATIITIASTVTFTVIGMGVSRYFGFNWIDSVMIGVAVMFSSTIIGLKLLPTTALHHQHIGEVVVSVLLMQDIIAILVLLVLNLWGAGSAHDYLIAIFRTLIAIPVLVLVAYFVERYVLHKLFKKYDRIREYVFLLAIGWCLGMAELGELFGVSLEIGAFIAGVALASSPISQYIAESLKPLRDFFLVVFFFSVGAGFDFHVVPQVLIFVCVMTLLVLLIKPLVFRVFSKVMQESSKTAWEIGWRLGQASEFSLLVGFLAYHTQVITEGAYISIEAVTILTFIISSYVIIMFFPSPLAIKAELRRD